MLCQMTYIWITEWSICQIVPSDSIMLIYFTMEPKTVFLGNIRFSSPSRYIISYFTFPDASYSSNIAIALLYSSSNYYYYYCCLQGVYMC